MPVIPELGGRGKADLYKFQASQDYSEDPVLNKQKSKQTKKSSTFPKGDYQFSKIM